MRIRSISNLNHFLKRFKRPVKLNLFTRPQSISSTSPLYFDNEFEHFTLPYPSRMVTENMSLQNATIIDGKAIAESIRNELSSRVKILSETYGGYVPHLAIIQVGNREDSSAYVKMKQQAALKVILLMNA